MVYPVQSRTRPRRNIWAYLAPVLILAIGFNIPKALEVRPRFVHVSNEKKAINLCTSSTNDRHDMKYSRARMPQFEKVNYTKVQVTNLIMTFLFNTHWDNRRDRIDLAMMNKSY